MQWFIGALGMLGTFTMSIGVLVALILFIWSFFEKDQMAKKKKRKIAFWSIVIPILLLVVPIILNFIVGFTQAL